MNIFKLIIIISICTASIISNAQITPFDKEAHEKWEEKMRTLPKEFVPLNHDNIQMVESSISPIVIGKFGKQKITISISSKTFDFSEEMFLKIITPIEVSVVPNSIVCSKNVDIRAHSIYFIEPILKHEVVTISYEIIPNSNIAAQKGMKDATTIKSITYQFNAMNSSGEKSIYYYNFGQRGKSLAFIAK